MPSARSATAAPRRQTRTSPRRRPRVVSRPPRLRVRWERVGRIGLLVVLAVVVALYVEHTLSYLSTRAQSDQQQAIVQSLTRQNAQLRSARRNCFSASLSLALAWRRRRASFLPSSPFTGYLRSASLYIPHARYYMSRN